MLLISPVLSPKNRNPASRRFLVAGLPTDAKWTKREVRGTAPRREELREAHPVRWTGQPRLPRRQALRRRRLPRAGSGSARGDTARSSGRNRGEFLVRRRGSWSARREWRTAATRGARTCRAGSPRMTYSADQYNSEMTRAHCEGPSCARMHKAEPYATKKRARRGALDSISEFGERTYTRFTFSACRPFGP